MSSPTEIRVLSVDDHAVLREGLAMVIRSQPDRLLAAQASNGREAILWVREHKPDVTLMDLRLPDMSGIDATISIRAEFPEARIIILTTFSDEAEIQRAFKAGARAYVLKSMPPKYLLEVIRQVHAGIKDISPDTVPRPGTSEKR
jgi:DNA-binding NarL/FixJ family response regulator